MTINATHEPITINNDPLEEVKDLTYLGNLLSKDNGAGKDIKARLLKSACSIRQMSAHLEVE